uniref:Wsv295 n=1 Tax=Chionoecetes opilio bacilliform virus TaxID=1825681 RepID=A0A1Q3DL30_9VIRU|nr:wsv295-like protein [Chionoecetes opilio bacilliform virus]GAV93237.1 hypothetical protein SCV_117 [Chionoecetes opilio bacilliform virus]
MASPPKNTDTFKEEDILKEDMISSSPLKNTDIPKEEMVSAWAPVDIEDESSTSYDENSDSEGEDVRRRSVRHYDEQSSDDDDEEEEEKNKNCCLVTGGVFKVIVNGLCNAINKLVDCFNKSLNNRQKFAIFGVVFAAMFNVRNVAERTHVETENSGLDATMPTDDTSSLKDDISLNTIVAAIIDDKTT